MTRPKTRQKPDRISANFHHHGQPLLPRVKRSARNGVASAGLLLLLTNCGGSGTETVDGNENMSQQSSGADGESTSSAGRPDTTENPAGSVSVTAETTSPNAMAESSPLQLFLDEIGLASAAPVLFLNARLAGGELLESFEYDCLKSFDPGTGKQATAINCSMAIPVYDSILEARQVDFKDSVACQSSLASGSSNNCVLRSAELNIPLQWVANPETPASPLGAASPIAGTELLYNTENDNLVNYRSNSSITAPFNCYVDINTAGFSSAQSSKGNCRAEADRVTRRLFEFRTSQ